MTGIAGVVAVSALIAGSSTSLAETELFSAAAAVGAAASPATIEPASTLQLTNLQSGFQSVASRVAPSVVAISATAVATDSDDAVSSDTLNGERLDALLQRTMRTVGTGFVIAADGYILTNEHVITDASQLWITTDDHKVFPAIVVGSDPRADLAVLKSPVHDLTPVRFAQPNSVKRGAWTIALGNPFGLAGFGEMSMSVGVVSATQRSLPKLSSEENRIYSDLIQTTAEINPGNSGGPLFNIDGEVIGISTAVIMPQKATNGIGFALPVTADLLAKVRDLREGREIEYGYLGVVVSTPTPRARRAAGVDESVGVAVDSVDPNSPAGAMLQSDDIITCVAGAATTSSEQFVRQISAVPIDRPTRFEVRRDKQTLTIDIQLRRREETKPAVCSANQRIHWQGMLLGPIPANWDFGKTARPEHGLMVIGIDPQSPMAARGIRSGSVLTAVAGKPINAITELQSIINDTPAEKCGVEILPATVTQVATSGR